MITITLTLTKGKISPDEFRVLVAAVCEFRVRHRLAKDVVSDYWLVKSTLNSWDIPIVERNDGQRYARVICEPLKVNALFAFRWEEHPDGDVLLAEVASAIVTEVW